MNHLTVEEYLELRLERLKKLMADKNPLVLLNARRLVEIFPRRIVPDWVEALANGNPAELDAVIETALADMEVEDGSNNQQL